MDRAGGSTRNSWASRSKRPSGAVGDGPHEAAILPGARGGVVTIDRVSRVPGHHLAVIDLRERRVSRSIELGPSTRPHGVAPLPARPGLVAVTSEKTRNVLLFKIETAAIERVIPKHAAGSHMVALPITGAAATARAYRANIGGGSTSELDIISGAPLRVLPVSTATQGIAVTPDGTDVRMGSNTRGTVSVLDVAKGTVDATLTPFRFPYRRGIGADGRTAVITSAGNSRVILVDLQTLKELRRFSVGQSPDGVGYFDR